MSIHADLFVLVGYIVVITAVGQLFFSVFIGIRRFIKRIFIKTSESTLGGLLMWLAILFFGCFLIVALDALLGGCGFSRSLVSYRLETQGCCRFAFYATSAVYAIIQFSTAGVDTSDIWTVKRAVSNAIRVSAVIELTLFSMWLILITLGAYGVYFPGSEIIILVSYSLFAAALLGTLATMLRTALVVSERGITKTTVILILYTLVISAFRIFRGVAPILLDNTYAGVCLSSLLMLSGRDGDLGLLSFYALALTFGIDVGSCMTLPLNAGTASTLATVSFSSAQYVEFSRIYAKSSKVLGHALGWVLFWSPDKVVVAASTAGWKTTLLWIGGVLLGAAFIAGGIWYCCDIMKTPRASLLDLSGDLASRGIVRRQSLDVTMRDALAGRMLMRPRANSCSGVIRRCLDNSLTISNVQRLEELAATELIHNSDSRLDTSRMYSFVRGEAPSSTWSNVLTVCRSREMSLDSLVSASERSVPRTWKAIPSKADFLAAAEVERRAANASSSDYSIHSSGSSAAAPYITLADVRRSEAAAAIVDTGTREESMNVTRQATRSEWKAIIRAGSSSGEWSDLSSTEEVKDTTAAVQTQIAAPAPAAVVHPTVEKLTAVPETLQRRGEVITTSRRLAASPAIEADAIKDEATANIMKALKAEFDGARSMASSDTTAYGLEVKRLAARLTDVSIYEVSETACKATSRVVDLPGTVKEQLAYEMQKYYQSIDILKLNLACERSELQPQDPRIEELTQFYLKKAALEQLILRDRALEIACEQPAASKWGDAILDFIEILLG